MSNCSSSAVLLITGCARSGTFYIAKVLETLGLRVTREMMGAPYVVSWPVLAGRFDVALHQVREPLSVMGSCQTLNDESWEHIYEHTHIARDAPLLTRCAEFWYYWNLRCQEMTDWTYRIEDLPDVWDTFCAWVGEDAEYAQVAHLPHTLNTREHTDVTWRDVEAATPLYSEIKYLAASYGYEGT